MAKLRENIPSNENSSINTSVELFDVPKGTFPSLEKLTKQNRLKILANTLEIQDYKKNSCSTFREFARISLKISKNIGLTLPEILNFQGSLTVYKNNPDIWIYLTNNKNYNLFRSILMKAVLLKKNMNAVDEILTLDKTRGTEISEAEDFDVQDRIIMSTAHSSEKLESRANLNYLRNIKFMEDLNMPANYINIFYEFADKIELYYRSKERSTENAIYGSGKELSSNHLLRVNRFGLGIMTSAWQNPAKFSPEDQQELLKRQNSPLEILKDSLLDIAHDIIEDGFVSAEDLYEIIYEIAIKHTSKKEAAEISREISQSAERLNSHNFHTKKKNGEIDIKSPRNYDVYLYGGEIEYEDGTSETFDPLNFREKFTKIKDMIHNWQTAIKINKPEKIKTYLRFIAENIHYLDLLRKDSIINILKFNLSNFLKFHDRENSDISIIYSALNQSLKDKQEIK